MAASDVGGNCFFPSENTLHDDGLPRVDARVYTSGNSRTQQDKARTFLEKVDVREVGEAEQVEAILKRRYSEGNVSPRKEDLMRFVALVEKWPYKARLFADYPIFERKDGRYGRPSEVFLDKPFLDTGLSAYYEECCRTTDCCCTGRQLSGERDSS